MTADHGAAPAPRHRRKSTALAPLPAGPEHFGLICGLPTSLTYLAADFARDLMQRAYGSCEVIGLNDMSEPTQDRLRQVHGPTLALTEVADSDVVRLVGARTFPVLVIEQGYAEACLSFMSLRKTSEIDTARTMAFAQIGRHALAELSSAVRIQPHLGQQARCLAEEIGDALGIPAEVVESMIDERDLTRGITEVLIQHFPSEADEQQTVASQLLEELEAFYCLPSSPRPTRWRLPLAAMIEAAPPHRQMAGPIDLLGPARQLICGPYLYLPRGKWKLAALLTYKGSGSGDTFEFDLTADKEIKSTSRHVLFEDASMELTSEVEIIDPFHPFEFRTFLSAGSIGGSIIIESVDVRSLD